MFYNYLVGMNFCGIQYFSRYNELLWNKHKTKLSQSVVCSSMKFFAAYFFRVFQLRKEGSHLFFAFVSIFHNK